MQWDKSKKIRRHLLVASLVICIMNDYSAIPQYVLPLYVELFH